MGRNMVSEICKTMKSNIIIHFKKNLNKKGVIKFPILHTYVYALHSYKKRDS